MAHDPQGFLRHARADRPKRPIAERVRDWQPIYLTAPGGHVQQQAARCMDCGVAFCHAGCPLGNLIPDWNEMVAGDLWAAASERLHATNNFPEFTGWICPAPCEAACVLAINTDPVTIKQVEISIVERAFADGQVPPQPPTVRTGRRVAVVGSGPAGLAAAQQLTRAGHGVTVFERDDRLGGLLRYGIPDFKMPKHVIDRRLAQMRAEGTVFRTSTNVERSDVDVLRSDYAAVVLAVGALQQRDVPVAGRDLPGVVQAMEYLPWGNRVRAGDLGDRPPPIDARGKHVIVIGGGDTAADCLGTANRQGALSVTLLDHNPMPQRDGSLVNPRWPSPQSSRGVSPAHDEGVHEAWSREVVEFSADRGGGAARGRRRNQSCARRRRRSSGVPRPAPGCPSWLLFAGFVDRRPRPAHGTRGRRTSGLGTAAVDAAWQTTAPGIFACGDATRGASLVVWAIAEGRACAASVDRYLGGMAALPEPLAPNAAAL